MDVSKSLKLLRSLRLANRYDIREDAMEALHQRIELEIFPDLARPMVVPARESARIEPRAPDKAPVPRKSAAQATHQLLRKIDLKIRRLLEADVEWRVLEPLLWEGFSLADDTRATAARMVELACLHADERDLIPFIEQMAKACDGFYPTVNKEVRSRIVIMLWRAKKLPLIAQFMKAQDPKERIGVEDLYQFHVDLAGGDPAETYMFFREREVEIVKAVISSGAALGFKLDQLYYEVGKLAYELGNDDDARIFFKKIDGGSAYHTEALNLLLKEKPTKQNGQCPYTCRLGQASGWEQRVSLIYSFLAEARRLGGIGDPHRPMLNQLLANPLRWVPASGQAWRAISKALVDYIDIVHFLPNLTTAFVDNATRFYSEELENALWSPVLEMVSRTGVGDLYWQSIAKLHLYVASKDADDGILWEAESAMRQVLDKKRFLPVHWENLHRAAYQHLSGALQIPEKLRLAKLRQLRMVLNPSKIVKLDVEEYLAEVPRPHLAILERLIIIANFNQETELELKLVVRKGMITHFTNGDLERIWLLASQVNVFDLAWRAATILKSRGALDDKVYASWDISGEKRNEYHLNTIDFHHVVEGIKEFSPEEQRVAKALLKVGPYIPELMHVMDGSVRPVKIKAAKSGSRDAEVDKLLASLKWLPLMKKQYIAENQTYAADNMVAPSVLHLLPDNTWSMLIVRLGQRLGVTAWGLRFSSLRRYFDAFMPKIATAKASYPKPLSRWLKTITPEARAAWGDLAAFGSRITDERGFELIGTLIARIAVMIHQNHFQALSSLRVMRWPVCHIWGLEKWILSDSYSSLRKRMGTMSRVPVPLALRQMTTILKVNLPKQF
jgi:hypothetical protein